MRITLALLALLAGSLTGCGSDSGDPHTLTLNELHRAAVAAGLECESFTEVDDLLFDGSAIVAMGGCSLYPEDTMLTIYTDRDAAQAGTKEILGPPQLLGENWIIRGEGAPDLADELGGEVVPANDGYAEARACEEQAKALLHGWVSGAEDTDPLMIAAIQEANATGSPAVTIAAESMSNDVSSSIALVGADAAVDMGMVGVATECRSHYIDGFRPNGLEPTDLGDVAVVPDATSEPSTDLDDESAGGVMSCEEVAPDLVSDAEGCAGAWALLERCNGVSAPLSVVSRDRVGILTWESSADQDGVAVTSQDSGSGDATVLSCGYPDNGVDVEAVYDAVLESAEQGWGITARSVSCTMTGETEDLLDTAPTGDAVAYCAVASADGAQAPAFVSITNAAPYYRVDLGE